MHRQSSFSFCACGCGEPTTLDRKGRPRKYVVGHYCPARVCPLCGAPSATASAIYCGAECRRRAFAARRGRIDHGDGYIRLYRPGHPLAAADGYVFEHRLVVHEAGITIPPGYHVHHVNGVKNDNRLENLEVLPPSRHHREHIHPGVEMQNQYGTYVVGTRAERAEEQRARTNARVAAWQAANPERVQEYKRTYYAANRERVIARVKAWKAAQRAKKIGR